MDKKKVKPTDATVCAGTKNEALGDFSSIRSGDNTDARGEYSTIPGRRNKQATGTGEIVLSHNGKVYLQTIRKTNTSVYISCFIHLCCKSVLFPYRDNSS